MNHTHTKLKQEKKLSNSYNSSAVGIDVTIRIIRAGQHFVNVSTVAW